MDRIVSTEDTLGGAPRIEGRRIGVHHIATRVLEDGVPPEQVAADYDLDLGDVYRALTYYYDNPEEMRDVRRQLRAISDDLRAVRGPEDLDAEERQTREA